MNYISKTIYYINTYVDVYRVSFACGGGGGARMCVCVRYVGGGGGAMVV